MNEGTMLPDGYLVEYGYGTRPSNATKLEEKNFKSALWIAQRNQLQVFVQKNNTLQGLDCAKYNMKKGSY